MLFVVRFLPWPARLVRNGAILEVLGALHECRVGSVLTSESCIGAWWIWIIRCCGDWCWFDVKLSSLVREHRGRFWRLLVVWRTSLLGQVVPSLWFSCARGRVLYSLVLGVWCGLATGLVWLAVVPCVRVCVLAAVHCYSVQLALFMLGVWCAFACLGLG